MVRTAVLGYPRMGPARELKKALEQFWTARSGREALPREAEKIRAAHWKLQKEAGIDFIPSGDFSFYDHVLDTACMLGAIPARYGTMARDGSLETYFAMARGSQKGNVAALEMTKWFDTNYHYIVPEIARDQRFALAIAAGHGPRRGSAARGHCQPGPCLLGPVTFLSLAKGADSVGGSSFAPGGGPSRL